jgi:hypothetical protein
MAARGQAGVVVGGDEGHPPRGTRDRLRRSIVEITPESTCLGPAMTPIYYEVRVAGTLPPEALLDFESLTAAVQSTETVVHGPLQDYAALAGLLARLEASGIEIVNVHHVHGQGRNR